MNCPFCGTATSSGRYCDTCSDAGIDAIEGGSSVLSHKHDTRYYEDSDYYDFDGYECSFCGTAISSRGYCDTCSDAGIQAIGL